MTDTWEWNDNVLRSPQGTQFVAVGKKWFPSEPDRFCIAKRPDLVDAHLALVAEMRPRAIVELGILQGGGAALLALATDATIICFDRTVERVAALDEFVTRNQLNDRVHLRYATDQADAEALLNGVNSAIGEEPLDLVIDDASHLVGPSTSSFNALFPRLRPGGIYAIEDWSWAHVGYGSHLPSEVPLTRLVFELTMAVPTRPGMVADIRITRDWALVRRGEAEIDPRSFAVADLYSERGRDLLTSIEP